MTHALPDLRAWLFGKSKPHVVLGTHGLFGLSSVTLDLDHFNTHLYVVGQSGQGKSKFLQQLFFQIAHTGWGVGVFDPHADLASDILAQLASTHPPWLTTHWQRVIYIDPSRTDYLIPCNILKNAHRTPYEIAENVVEAFKRVWPDTLNEAPRFSQILRNAVTTLALNSLSLLELEPLLTDKDFRMRLLSNVEDTLVVSFFTHQYDQWGRDQAIFASPVLNKVSAFLFTPQVRLMLGANENQLDFRRVIDEGKVLIVNLGGFHSEETQRLLGSLLVTSLEQAAFSRSKIQPSARRPFLCLLDEFPLFCSRDQTSLARILSECRKYRLHLGLAHQTIGQLPGQRIQGALENAKLKVIFGTGRQTAQAIVGDLFLPDTKAVKHEVEDEEVKDRTHPVFWGLQDQFEGFVQKIQTLHRQHVLIKIPEHKHIVTAHTPTVPPSHISAKKLEEWKCFLAKKVGLPREILEEQIAQREKNIGIPMQEVQSLPSPRATVPQDTDDLFWQ
jgi:hypothetical protein